MFISKIFACIATLLCVFTVMQHFSGKKKDKKPDGIVRKLHIPAGILLLVTGLVHGIFAGNAKDATLSNFQPCAVLFTFNYGTICLVFAILLAATYMFRKILKKNWIVLHRLFTVGLVASLFLHLMFLR